MESYFSASEVVQQFEDVSVKKANNPIYKTLFLGFMAGAFIAMGANASSAAAFNVSNYGLSKLVAGLVFPIGLIFVILGGAELFTGNMLISIGVLNKKITVNKMLKNWCLVWIGNLLGALTYSFLVSQTIQFDSSHGELGGYVLKLAAGKVNMSFMAVFVSGILCNWIVCQTVFIAYTTKNVAGKILAMYLPIMLFVITGFEHVVANMYYLLAALFVKGNATYVADAVERGASLESIQSITLSNIFVNNLLPATLGNIFGGVVLVAVIYVYMYTVKNDKKK